jgi:hypothetical protein
MPNAHKRLDPAGHRLGAITSLWNRSGFARRLVGLFAAALAIAGAGPMQGGGAVHVSEPPFAKPIRHVDIRYHPSVKHRRVPSRKLPIVKVVVQRGQLPIVQAVVQRDPLIDVAAKAAISPDGHIGAVVGKTFDGDGMAVLWDLDHQRVIRTLPLRGASGEILQLRFTADGTGLSWQSYSGGSEGDTSNDDLNLCELQRWSVDLKTGRAHSAVLVQVTKANATEQQRDQCSSKDWGALSGPLPYDLDRPTLIKLQGQPLRLSGRQGQAPVTFSVTPQPTSGETIISPDATRLLLVDWRDKPAPDEPLPITEEIRIFDLRSMRFVSAKVVPRVDKGEVAWVDSGHYLIAGDGTTDAVVIDADSGITSRTIPGRCDIKPVGSKFYGAGAGKCVDDTNDQGIAVYDAEGGWRKLDIGALRGRNVLALAVRPDESEATAIVDGVGSGRDAIKIDLRTHTRVGLDHYSDEDGMPRVGYLADGRVVIDDEHADAGARVVWRPGASETEAVHPDVIDSQAKSLYADALLDGSVPLREHGSNGNALATNVCAGTLSDMQLALHDFAGTTVMSDGGKFLADGSSEIGIRIYDMQHCQLALTIQFMQGNRFFANTPDGRYDTDLAPDTTLLRWTVRDAPLASVAPQAFMRQYYEPGLARRLLDCIAEPNCEAPFKRVPDVLSLNRVLPRVRELVVRDGPTPDTVQVDIAVEPVVDPSSPNGKTRSGLYNLRLFRANALVAEWKNPAAAPGAQTGTLDAWRDANLLQIGPDGAFHASTVVRLPTGTTARDIAFSAYAFNEDRVKSDTVTIHRHLPPVATPRPRRAFVLAIGINRYDAAQLQLKYAAPDALLIAQRLGVLPGYDVRPLPLVGSDMRVTKALIGAALTLLATPPFGSEQAYSARRATALATLHAAGIDGTAFEPATPDDLVIISYSGHGWTDPAGNFFMLPADAKWLPTGPPADHASLIGAEELADWLEAIDAGDMALVIDACHSAASVAAGGFKPGPMGDAGLGQLAYDKGIRIIAASQTQDVAFEDERLQHGLLTYALAQEGLDDQGFGAADLDHDRRIMLDEWLSYAVAELPSLSTKVRRRHIADGFGGKRRVTVIDDSLARPKPQIPALFDFHSAPSGVVLRTAKAP